MDDQTPRTCRTTPLIFNIYQDLKKNFQIKINRYNDSQKITFSEDISPQSMRYEPMPQFKYPKEIESTLKK